MSGILVVTEQTAGVWNRMSFETLAAGQALAELLGKPVCAVVFGQATGALAKELAGYQLDKAIALEHELLGEFTSDAATAALAWLIAQVQPDVVLFPHTYRVRDFAPCLAARAGQTLVSDVTGLRVEDGALVLQRQLFQGKLNADYASAGAGPVFASLQASAFRADSLEKGEAPVETLTPPLDAAAIRQRPDAPYQESARTVDLSTANMIVAVGRGIHEEGNLALVQELADVLGAELAASRPICDNGWMPMERQVGSSGQTVAPKLYLAVGISGAIQHLVGMKGSRTIVAINKDTRAPIFEVADYGIVGDLFDVVPALIEEVRKAKNQ
ncbi:MAG: electron transfer flavoprotein subunit alpha/FixB family protein [Bryobacteraceae bacterium]|nr:electron transfer flavoprotein subunit alpha/FixB family protein [Bryobacteraceae bacterium]